MRFRKSMMAALCFIALPATAQDAPQMVTVTLTSYSFTPKVLVLKVGVPAHLHLVNAATKEHSFSAPEFFAAAAVADAGQARIRNGVIGLKGGESADLTVTPARSGTYPLKCSHFMHTAMGMTGSITVQ